MTSYIPASVEIPAQRYSDNFWIWTIRYSIHWLMASNTPIACSWKRAVNCMIALCSWPVVPLVIEHDSKTDDHDEGKDNDDHQDSNENHCH